MDKKLLKQNSHFGSLLALIVGRGLHYADTV